MVMNSYRWYSLITTVLHMVSMLAYEALTILQWSHSYSFISK
jgi:hypothetical protein